MKIYYLVLMLSALFFSACGVSSTEKPSALTQNTVSQVATVPTEGHYVRVVLPAKETVKGSSVTINMEGSEPIKHNFPQNLDWKNPTERMHVFSIKKPLKPATMTVIYNDGTSHTMSQVIFDTTIETP